MPTTAVGHVDGADPSHSLVLRRFEDGLVRRPLKFALEKRHLEFNPGSFIHWLIYDLDDESSYEVWDRVDFPPPNLYVQNPRNGHGHLFYALATPVGLRDAHRSAPMEFAADVQRGMVKRFEADSAYTNRFAKNPLHPHWRRSWLRGQPYDLKTLRERLYQQDLRWESNPSGVSGIGRNCSLFDQLRQHAYANVRAQKTSGTSASSWKAQLVPVAQMMNAQFSQPLSASEVRAIANSVAKWTWAKFTAHEFSKIQSARASK